MHREAAELIPARVLAADRIEARASWPREEQVRAHAEHVHAGHTRKGQLLDIARYAGIDACCRPMHERVQDAKVRRQGKSTSMQAPCVCAVALAVH